MATNNITAYYNTDLKTMGKISKFDTGIGLHAILRMRLQKERFSSSRY
jgi:hypothetical protein